MRLFLFYFFLSCLTACNQVQQKSKKSTFAGTKDTHKISTGNNFIELSNLRIEENYQPHSNLTDFNTKFKVIDSVIYSKDELGNGDTIATFFIENSRFNYSKSAVYFTHLDLGGIEVSYNNLPLNFLDIDSICNILSISKEKMEVSSDTFGKITKRIFLNTKSTELTDDQAILVFVNDSLKHIQYFNGND